MSFATAKAPSSYSWLILPFVNSVRQVFEKMVGIRPTFAQPYLTTENSNGHDICGVVGFSGTVSGSVVVSFTRQAATKLVESFAGERLDFSHPDFCDAIGELSNLIAGSAKSHIAGGTNISLPNVMVGKCQIVGVGSETPYVVIPCSSAHGEFAVEVRIRKTVVPSRHRPRVVYGPAAASGLG